MKEAFIQSFLRAMSEIKGKKLVIKKGAEVKPEVRLETPKEIDDKDKPYFLNGYFGGRR